MMLGRRFFLLILGLACLAGAGIAPAQFAFEPNDHLALIGNGLADRMQHDGWLESYLQAANPDLIFTGFQSGVALSRYYASADIFLFPSVTDTFGNVVTEAAASGLAVVAFDRGAAGELLEHEKSGWVIPGEDDSDYMAACTDLALRIGSAQSPIPEIRMRAREAACAVWRGSPPTATSCSWSPRASRPRPPWSSR